MKMAQYSSWMLERLAIGDTVRLRFGNTTMGRHSSSNIRVLEASFVSRHHAVIEVSDNDEDVSIRDVSSNGIYVNEKRYDKIYVPLKNNDLIGFGVSPIDLEDGVDLLKLPIYQLKYAPITKTQVPNVAKLPEAATSGLKDNCITTIKKEIDHCADRNDSKPCCSKSIKTGILINPDEIFEISDDDDESDAKKNPSNINDEIIKQKPVVTEKTGNVEQQKLPIDSKNQINFLIKTEPFDNKDCINASKKSQEKAFHNKILNVRESINDEYKVNPSQKSLDQNSKTKIGIDVESGEEKKINIDQATTTSDDCLHNKREEESLIHIPIISNIKKEQIQSVSADIQNIFGDIEGYDEIQKTIKEINPFVFNAINASQNLVVEKTLNNGDFVNLIDDEDLEEVKDEPLSTIVPKIMPGHENNGDEQKANQEVETTKMATNISIITETKQENISIIEKPKSPNIFDSSLDNSVEENNHNHKADNVDLENYMKYVPNSDDEDIEDLMFSQVLINDMKAELEDSINDQENLLLPNANIDSKIPVGSNSVVIKQEPDSENFSQIPKELQNSCWIISDDEDYDEELETKVNDWSNKIFSQSFNTFSQNMSQVYEIEDDHKNDGNEEEEEFFEEDDFNLLEDDIDGIANIYNSDYQILDKNLKSKEMKKTEEKPANEVISEADKVKNDIKLEKLEIEYGKKDEINQREMSPIQNNCSSYDVESPIIHPRRSSKTRIVIKSSSSEDESDPKNQDLVALGSNKSKTKKHPTVIDAPILPKHRGKLRGVSAEVPKKSTPNLKSRNEHKTIKSIKDKIFEERYSKDLKRKWLEKPSITKKREKEHKKYIKERRKDKLKELAERMKDPLKQNLKRKLLPEGQEPKAKVAKVKVTAHNRGAFLANNEPTPLPPSSSAALPQKPQQIPQFKIPKVVKNSDEHKNPHSVENNNKTSPPPRSLSVDSLDTFSQQISKPDTLLFKKEVSESKKFAKSCHIRRHSVTEAINEPIQPYGNNKTTSTLPGGAICKESIAKRAVRTTNKITFASMEKNIVENEENKRKLTELSGNSATPLAPVNKSNSSTMPTAKKLKKVRFNDTPVVHYIERITGACKKINNKDVMPMTTYRDRCHLIRSAYPLIDYTDKIISKILCWSNEWLIKRNASADAASDVIYPMPTQLNSFEHYKSVILPLMKLEFVSTLEREYNITHCVKKFKVSLEYVIHNQERIKLITKCVGHQDKELKDSSFYDLVLLEADKKCPQMFAFVVSNRRGSGFLTIEYEIMAKTFTTEYFNAIKEFNVRPVMDKVRVHFGAFNSVYQLQSTPLFQKIINPLELLKCRNSPKKKVSYRGFDELNDKQRQVLLNTYVRVIDETTPNITLIQGPPGTGKSRVITNLILQTLYGEEVRYLDKKILVCAQGNAAVDVIASKLYNISMKMRPEKRFRLIRYGMMSKMNPSVLPIALQKIVEHDQLKKLQAKNKHIQLENKENLRNQILLFEAQVAEMSLHNVKGTVEEDVLTEKKRQLQLMRNILNENMRPEDERSLFSWYLCNANIICATLASCVNLSQYINFFDICIIDEATQCTEPWTLLPLKFGINSLVLVGDTQQLPATVLSKKANELGLSTSMFTRIQHSLDNVPCTSVNAAKANVTTPNNIIYSLQTQYRMHPEICRWPNKYFYRNELINDKSTLAFNKSSLVPFSILSLTYKQNTSGFNGKITNDLEADFVAKLLKALDAFIPNKYNSYGVITPYAHHRAALESSIRIMGLTNIMVNTIDSYQGLEKDVIVISNARTSGIGFLSNPQRLNVALTRAKKCLILCGNFKNLESVPVWRCLMENARERKLYHEISANCIEDMQTHVIDKIKIQNP